MASTCVNPGVTPLIFIICAIGTIFILVFTDETIKT